MDRTWIIDGNPIEAETSEEIAEAIFEASRILDRVGGAIVMVAQREEVAPTIYQTVSVLFKWSSYVPAKRLEAEPDPDPEPVAAAA